MGIPNLPLGHSQQRFLIAVIAFDLPAINICLNQRLQVQLQVSADQKRRLAVQQLGTVAQPITQRLDHDHLERQVDARFAPVDPSQHFHRNVVKLAGGKASHLDRLHRLVAQDLFRRRSRGSVPPWASDRYVGCGFQRKV